MEVLQSENQQLPLQQPQHAKINQLRKQQEGERGTGGEREKHFHVLAVDDSQIDRKILEQLLTVSSYRGRRSHLSLPLSLFMSSEYLTSVDSGDKALEFLGLVDNPAHSSSSSSSSHQQGSKGVQVNLIMTDYSMPGMSGYDLLKRVKGSSWKDVPVVVMSSENVPSRIHMCLEEGAEEFLLKPVQLSDLEKLQPRMSKTLRCENTNTGANVKQQEIMNSINDGNYDNRREGEAAAVAAMEASSDMIISPPPPNTTKLNLQGLAVA